MTTDMLTIDGRDGEGGGQILRTSLALSAITGRSFRIHHIRGGRRKSGLLRQHLTAVRALASISRAELHGAELRSGELEVHPGPIEHGDYHFAVGSAGSAMLVFQTVLWPLLVTPGRSRVVFEGGTHNPMSPPFEFIDQVFLPHMRELGVVAELSLERAGFNPAGGGRVVAVLEGGRALRGLELVERGPVLERGAAALVANLPRRVGVSELGVVRRELGWSREQCRVLELEGSGPGNALQLWARTAGGCELITSFGDRGRPAEAVAVEATTKMKRWLDAGVPVGEHLADQLLIPMALAAVEGGHCSRFDTLELSRHTKTNADVIARFLPVTFEFEDGQGGGHRVRSRPTP